MSSAAAMNDLMDELLMGHACITRCLGRCITKFAQRILLYDIQSTQVCMQSRSLLLQDRTEWMPFRSILSNRLMPSTSLFTRCAFRAINRTSTAVQLRSGRGLREMRAYPVNLDRTLCHVHRNAFGAIILLGSLIGLRRQSWACAAGCPRSTASFQCVVLSSIETADVRP